MKSRQYSDLRSVKIFFGFDAESEVIEIGKF